MKTATKLGEAIRKLRRVLGGLTQEQFARRMGVTVRTAARWESSDKVSRALLIRFEEAAHGAHDWDLVDVFFSARLGEELPGAADRVLPEKLHKTRNELANWYRMARETGKIAIGKEDIDRVFNIDLKPFKYCSLCYGTLMDDGVTDELGTHHEHLLQCITALSDNLVRLEYVMDHERETRRQLYRCGEELRALKQKMEKG
jgi:transcriptional regulator with XRE-family HTH domain